MSKKWASLLLFACLITFPLLSCYQEKSGSAAETTKSSVVVGCGLSETLSLLRIKDNDQFSVDNDVQQTCQAISKMIEKGDKIFGLCSLSNSIIVYKKSDLKIITEYALGNGKNPISFCFDSSDRVWVSNFISETVEVYKIREDDLKLVKTFDLSGVFSNSSSRPSGIGCSPSGVFAVLENLDDDFLPAGNSAIAVFNPAELKLAGTFEISGKDAIAAEFRENDGFVYVTCAGDYEWGTGFKGNGRLVAFDPQEKREAWAIDISGAPFELEIWKNFAIMGNGKEGKILLADLEKQTELPPIDIRQSDSTGLSYVSALETTSSDLLVAAEFNQDRLFVFDLNGFEKLQDFSVCDGPDALVSVE